MLRTAIQPHLGTPTLFVDDRPHSGAMYTTLRLDPQSIADFVAAGVGLFAIDTTSGCHYYRFCQQVWNGPDEFDYADLDGKIRLILAACPKALIVLRVYVGSPTWWDELHPDQLMLEENGEEIDEKPTFGFLGGIDLGLGPVKHSVPSFSSKRWRADAQRGLARYVEHAEAAFGDHIAGYLLESGGTEEWYYWKVFAGAAADYSKPQTESFIEAARVRGLDAHAIPSVELRRSTSGGGFFRDPEGERAVIEYTRFHNEIVADMLIECARTVKAASQHRKVCGAFYGYAFDLCRSPHVWPESGHLALDRVLSAPEVDFLVSPSSYIDRRLGDGVALLGGPVASIALHGKLWWNENDQYTHLTPETGSKFYHRAANRSESVALHRREIASSICQGSPQWWFDMHGGWFAGDDLMSEIRLQREILDEAGETDRRSVAQIALVIDYESPLYTESHNRLYQWLIRDLVLQLAKVGAPFDVLLMSDIDQAREYRFYIFANAFFVDKGLRGKLSVVLDRPGVHALWMYAPGYLNGGAAGVADLTGFRVEERSPGGKLCAAMSPGFGGVHESIEFGPGFELDPQLTVRSGCDVLARYTTDASPALVGRNTGLGSTLFAAVPGLPTRVLRELVKTAGVHVYSDSADQVWACRDWLGISWGSSGRREIRFPESARLREAFSGRELGTDSRCVLSVEAAKGETLLFRRFTGG